MRGAQRISLYVLNRTLLGMAAALAMVTSVTLLVVFVELSRGLSTHGDLGFFTLIGLMLLQAPAVVLVVAPFVVLFGVMGAFISLNRRGELVAMRATGISAWGFIGPSAGLAAAFGVLTATVLNPLAADLNSQFEDRRAALTAGQSAARELWLRQGDERHQIVIHARRHDLVDGLPRLQNVSFFVQNVGAEGDVDFSHRIEAAEARLTPGFWRLRDAREALPGAQTVRSDQLSIPSSLDRRAAMEKLLSPKSVAFWRLPATIASTERAGASAAGYRVRFHQLLAMPLLFMAMAVLGAAFSLRLMRLGDLAGLAISGVSLGFGVYFLSELCAALGASEAVPPFLAAWTPPLLALLAGVTRLCCPEDG